MYLKKNDYEYNEGSNKRQWSESYLRSSYMLFERLTQHLFSFSKYNFFIWNISISIKKFRKIAYFVIFDIIFSIFTPSI